MIMEAQMTMITSILFWARKTNELLLHREYAFSINVIDIILIQGNQRVPVVPARQHRTGETPAWIRPPGWPQKTSLARKKTPVRKIALRKKEIY
jgi:hypothetical protein